MLLDAGCQSLSLEIAKWVFTVGFECWHILLAKGPTDSPYLILYSEEYKRGSGVLRYMRHVDCCDCLTQ